MDFRIYQNKEELNSTGFMEIGPGKYSGKHWQDGFVFVWEDAFGMAEGVICKHFPEYDHFSMNDIPASVGSVILREWRELADRIVVVDAEELHRVLNLNGSYRGYLDQEIHKYREEVAAMLRELADHFARFYEHGEWVCILGV